MQVQFKPKASKPNSLPQEGKVEGTYDIILNDYIVIVPEEVVDIDLGFYIAPEANSLVTLTLSDNLANLSLVLLQPTLLCAAFFNTPAILKVKSLFDDYVQIRPGRMVCTLSFNEILRVNATVSSPFVKAAK